MKTNDKLVRASVAVTLAAQRENGLWFKPTSELDFDSYSPEGGKDDASRKDEPFGYASITVSWYALCGLKRVLGRDLLNKLVKVDLVIDQICNMRAPSGAYGTWHDGWQANRRVINSSRHTAVALLCQIDFADHLGEPASFQHLRSSVDWLLAGRTAEGGWRHDPKTNVEPEPLTTAAVVCALSAVTARFTEDVRSDAALHNAIVTAIEAAVPFLKKALIANERGQEVLWKPGHKQQGFQVSDTAETFDFLVRAMTFAKGDLLAPALAALEGDVADFIAAYDPHHDAGADQHTLASVLALRATCVASGIDRCAAAAESLDLDRARATLAQKIAHQPHKMRVWSWLCVLNSSDPNAGLGLGEYGARVEGACKASASGRKGGKLDSALWAFVPRIAQTAILYTFSRGRPEDVPVFAVDRIYRALPAAVRWPLRGVGALSLILLGAFIENSTSSFSWMRWPAG